MARPGWHVPSVEGVSSSKERDLDGRHWTDQSSSWARASDSLRLGGGGVKYMSGCISWWLRNTSERNQAVFFYPPIMSYSSEMYPAETGDNSNTDS